MGIVRPIVRNVVRAVANKVDATKGAISWSSYWTLQSTGNGTGVATLKMQSSDTVTLTITSGTARFYSNAAGTLDESTTATITSGALRTFYLKNTSGSSVLKLSDRRLITKWGDLVTDGWASSTNAPTVSVDVTDFTNITHYYVEGNNTNYGSITTWSKLVVAWFGGYNTITGVVSATTHPDIQYFECMPPGLNTISGSLNGMLDLYQVCFQGAVAGAITCDIETCPAIAYISSNTAITWSGSVTGNTILWYVAVPGITGSLAGVTALRFYYDYGSLDKLLRLNLHDQIDTIVLGTTRTYSNAEINQLLADLVANKAVARPSTYRLIDFSYVIGGEPDGTGIVNMLDLQNYQTPTGGSGTLKVWDIRTNIAVTIPSVIGDGNTIAWYDASDLLTVTKDGSDKVSFLSDKLQSVRYVQATGALMPLWTADGILFNGSDNAMFSDAMTYEQPEFIYLVLKQITWTANDLLFDGLNVYGSCIYNNTATPKIGAYAGTASADDSNLTLDTFCIIRVLFNGASSKLIVNGNAAITGDFGAGHMDGIVLGSRGTVAHDFAHIQVKEVIFRTISDSAANEALIYNYLNAKYSLGLTPL